MLITKLIEVQEILRLDFLDTRLDARHNPIPETLPDDNYKLSRKAHDIQCHQEDIQNLQNAIARDTKRKKNIEMTFDMPKNINKEATEEEEAKKETNSPQEDHQEGKISKRKEGIIFNETWIGILQYGEKNNWSERSYKQAIRMILGGEAKIETEMKQPRNLERLLEVLEEFFNTAETPPMLASVKHFKRQDKTETLCSAMGRYNCRVDTTDYTSIDENKTSRKGLLMRAVLMKICTPEAKRAILQREITEEDKATLKPEEIMDILMDIAEAEERKSWPKQKFRILKDIQTFVNDTSKNQPRTPYHTTPTATQRKYQEAEEEYRTVTPLRPRPPSRNTPLAETAWTPYDEHRAGKSPLYKRTPWKEAERRTPWEEAESQADAKQQAQRATQSPEKMEEDKEGE
jgi:hypothetical protein